MLISIVVGDARISQNLFQSPSSCVEHQKGWKSAPCSSRELCCRLSLSSWWFSLPSLLLSEQGCDFWSGLGDDLLAPAQVKEAKQLLVTLILATDMANHGSDLNALKSKISEANEGEGSEGSQWALQAGDEHKADRTLALKVGPMLLATMFFCSPVRRLSSLDI